jgi:hypothetical protein
MGDCTPYTALTRFLRGLDPDVPQHRLTFGELHAAIGQRLPMGAEIASAWDGPECSLGKAVRAGGFTARLESGERGWIVVFTRKPSAVRA